MFFYLEHSTCCNIICFRFIWSLRKVYFLHEFWADVLKKNSIKQLPGIIIIAKF